MPPLTVVEPLPRLGLVPVLTPGDPLARLPIAALVPGELLPIMAATLLTLAEPLPTLALALLPTQLGQPFQRWS
jgi:hypothetical protein